MNEEIWAIEYSEDMGTPFEFIAVARTRSIAIDYAGDMFVGADGYRDDELFVSSNQHGVTFVVADGGPRFRITKQRLVQPSN